MKLPRFKRSEWRPFAKSPMRRRLASTQRQFNRETRLADDFYLERRIRNDANYNFRNRRFSSSPENRLVVGHRGKIYVVKVMKPGKENPDLKGEEAKDIVIGIGKLSGEDLSAVPREEALQMIKKGKIVENYFKDARYAGGSLADTYSLIERLKKNERTSFGAREQLMSMWYRFRPSLRLTSGESRFGITVNTPVAFAKNIRAILQNRKLKTRHDKADRSVITVTGYRGAGKTTALNEMEKIFSERGIKPAFIEMDAYFREPAESVAPGGWDNPRNSHINQLMKAIKDFKAGND